MIATSEPEARGRTNQALTEAECICLLAGESIGRVVYTDGVLPSAFPVNYLLLNRSIVFRTKPDARVLLTGQEPYVSFEIDHVDELTRSGWSVLVTGRCLPLHPTIAGTLLDTWASTVRTSLHGISIDVVVGRRLEMQ